jgi:hypothetical protein
MEEAYGMTKLSLGAFWELPGFMPPSFLGVYPQRARPQHMRWTRFPIMPRLSAKLCGSGLIHTRHPHIRCRWRGNEMWSRSWTR